MLVVPVEVEACVPHEACEQAISASCVKDFPRLSNQENRIDGLFERTQVSPHDSRIDRRYRTFVRFDQYGSSVCRAPHDSQKWFEQLTLQESCRRTRSWLSTTDATPHCLTPAE